MPIKTIDWFHKLGNLLKYIYGEIFEMKKLLLILFCLFSVQMSFGQDIKFYDQILNYENCRHCYFIVLDVDSQEYTGKVIIENDDLFDFLNKTKGFNKKQYKDFIKEVLINKKKLYLKDATLSKYKSFLHVKNVNDSSFFIVKSYDKDDKVTTIFEEVASKGCVSFIEHYFLGKDLNDVGKFDSMNCHEFIANQEQDLGLKVLKYAEKEQSLIINKLFEWQIPVRIADISNLPVIDKHNFKKLLTKD